jgi:hypothetical protein
VKLLEYMQAAATAPSLDNCLQFAQQLELIWSFGAGDHGLKETAANLEVANVDRNKPSDERCKFCGRSHARGRCPAYGKTCSKYARKNHFAVVCRSSKAAHEIKAEDGPQGDPQFMVYNVRSARNNNIRSVKIDGHLVPMQLDSGSGLLRTNACGIRDTDILPKRRASWCNKVKIRRWWCMTEVIYPLLHIWIS